MGLFIRKPKTSIEDFCRQFYDSQIFYVKTGDEDGASTFWQNALNSIVEVGPSLAKVDRDLFRQEITALHMELFGLAWVPYLAQKSSGEHQRRYEKLLLRQIAFTKSYLELNGHFDIWKMILTYNKISGDILEGSIAKDHLVEDWTKRGCDLECTIVAVYHLRALLRGAMRQDLFDYLTATFAERLGWHLRPDSNAFLHIRSLISLVYENARCHLETIVIDSIGIVKSRFYDSAHGVGLGVVWILVVCLFYYLLAGNPLHELALIQNGQTVPGVIVNADEEPPADRSGSWSHTLWYTYNVDGREFTETVVEDGRLPRGFSPPCAIEVEYLPDKPAVSRIKGTGYGNIWSWLLLKVGLGGLLFTICVSPGIYYGVWKGVRDLRHLRSIQKDIVL